MAQYSCRLARGYGPTGERLLLLRTCHKSHFTGGCIPSCALPCTERCCAGHARNLFPYRLLDKFVRSLAYRFVVARLLAFTIGKVVLHAETSRTSRVLSPSLHTFFKAALRQLGLPGHQQSGPRIPSGNKPLYAKGTGILWRGVVILSVNTRGRTRAP